MIICRFYFTDKDFVKSFIVEGHSCFLTEGASAVKGNDILCSGVSTLIQGIIIGLKYAADADILINEKRSGYLDVSVGNPQDEKVFVLLKTLYISLKELEKDFPNNLRIEEVEYGS